MMSELAKLRFARFRFRLRIRTPLRLPPYKGSTLRGGFGIAFKEAVCVVQHRDCDRCILRSKCAYTYIFETPVPAGSRRMASYEHAPHPFVIEPPLDTRRYYNEGDALDFGLVLIGRAIDYLPYFIFAFEELGRKRGIGSGASEREREGDGDRNQAQRHGGRGKFSVEGVELLNAPDGGTPVYDGRSQSLRGEIHPQTINDLDDGSPLTLDASPLTIEFLTPTRLVFDRQLAPVPQFHILVRNLLRRLSNLIYFHCDAELDLDFRGLIDAAQRVRLVDNQTRWHDWERYSARQDENLQMGGLVGSAIYDGNAAFAPLLALGEVLHFGKGTVFGLGKSQMVRSQIRSTHTHAPGAPIAEPAALDAEE